MRISVKCSSAIHTLLVIAIYSKDNKVTSDFISKSIGNNPVEVRKLLSGLKSSGIIDVARGAGGATLKKSAEDITLLDIYSAVDSVALQNLIGIHSNSSKICPIGKNINDVLDDTYIEISDSISCKMQSITLENILQKLYKKEPSLITI